jgi:nitrogen fixation protein FixH
MTLPLTPRGAGLYQANVKLPLPGLWDIRIFAARGEDHAEILRRVVLK